MLDRNLNSFIANMKKLPSKCNSGDIIVKLKSCGVCGSDLLNIFSRSSKPTLKIGHEVSGIISEIGENVKKFQIDDRVLINHHCPCGKCYLCMKGNQTLCEKFRDGLEPCGMAEKFLVPEWIVKNGGVFRIPNSISFDEATLIEPLACCLKSWKKIRFSKNDSIAIFGMGPIGMTHSILARHYGLKKIFCLDIDEFRVDYCGECKLGIPINTKSKDFLKIIKEETDEFGVDFVIIATSDLKSLLYALDIVRKGGMILVFGEPNLHERINIDFSKVYEKEISLVTSYASTNLEFEESIELVRDKVINLEKLVTHKFPLGKIKEAINFAKNSKNRMKVIVTN